MNTRALGASALIVLAVCVLPIITRAQIPAAPTGSATPPPASESLKEKSDAELLQIVTGSKALVEPKQKVYDDDLVTVSALDRLWEMTPRDAALAFAREHVGKEAADAVLKIADPNAQPPKSGEIGLRWIGGNKYAPRAEGVTILKYDGYRSQLLLSEVEIAGKAAKAEIEAAVMKTDAHPLRRRVAQQSFEILWWLRHVRFEQEPAASSSATYSSADDIGKFWIKPGGPAFDKAIIGEPCGHCIARDGIDSYESFAAKLLRRLQERSGIKSRYPVPKIGRHIDPDADARFLHTPPPEQHDSEPAKQWIGRLVAILGNPERQYLHSDIIEILVPASDPLRYRDDGIDTALRELVRRGLNAARQLAIAEQQAEQLYDIDAEKFPDAESFEKEVTKRRNIVSAERRRIQQIQFTGMLAVQKLGFHDSVVAYPELLRLAADPKIESTPHTNRPLIAAASIAARHADLQAPLAEQLRGQLAATDGSVPLPALEAIWRADLRELSQEIERIASTPPPADTRPFWSPAHNAAIILKTWREPDPLTRTKLHAMLSGYIGGSNSIPQILRAEFDGLAGEQQLAFRQFVGWLRTVDVPWSRRCLEDTFAPHTPRPEIHLEY